VKGIDVGQPLWPEAVRQKLNNRQKMFFVCF
jgi:hypothetical protein